MVRTIEIQISLVFTPQKIPFYPLGGNCPPGRESLTYANDRPSRTLARPVAAVPYTRVFFIIIVSHGRSSFLFFFFFCSPRNILDVQVNAHLYDIRLVYEIDVRCIHDRLYFLRPIMHQTVHCSAVFSTKTKRFVIGNYNEIKTTSGISLLSLSHESRIKRGRLSEPLLVHPLT